MGHFVSDHVYIRIFARFGTSALRMLLRNVAKRIDYPVGARIFRRIYRSTLVFFFLGEARFLNGMRIDPINERVILASMMNRAVIRLSGACILISESKQRLLYGNLLRITTWSSYGRGWAARWVFRYCAIFGFRSPRRFRDT